MNIMNFKRIFAPAISFLTMASISLCIVAMEDKPTEKIYVNNFKGHVFDFDYNDVENAFKCSCTGYKKDDPLIVLCGNNAFSKDKDGNYKGIKNEYVDHLMCLECIKSFLRSNNLVCPKEKNLKNSKENFYILYLQKHEKEINEIIEKINKLCLVGQNINSLKKIVESGMSELSSKDKKVIDKILEGDK